MNKDELLLLRELIRADMRENDYCIGEEYVEKFFRKLLDEPEPSVVRTESKPNPNLTDILSMHIDLVSKKIPSLFERDDTFYKKIK